MKHFASAVLVVAILSSPTLAAQVGGGAASTAGAQTTPPPDDPQISKVPSLPDVTRGQQVVIQGKNFSPATYSVYLSATAGSPDTSIRFPATASADKLTLAFTIPSDASVGTGRYLVWVSVGGKTFPVPGDLRVIADAQAKVTIDAIAPTTVYPSDAPGRAFEISGTNLGNPASNNVLLVNHVPVTTVTGAACSDSTARGPSAPACLSVDRGMEGRKLRISGFRPGKYDGPVTIEVQVGNNRSNPIQPTFSRFSESWVQFDAVIVAALIFLVVGYVVTRAPEVDGEEGGKKKRGWKRWTGAVRGFLIDKETNSYSLSKFQLVTWTLVFVTGYLYLFLCRLLIQWKTGMPPIPDNMPAMLAISAGTTVVAVGATESRGSKGAGPIGPSVADFISTGGVVVGERFQFFVWTLVGAFAFLSMLLLTDPSTLVALPPIPDSFLFLMGISSAGYLAGKVARKPGPVVRALSISSITPAAAGKIAMSMKVVGDNIAEDATVKVDDKALRITDEYTLKGTKHDDQAPDPTFCNEVELVLLDAGAYLEGSHRLTLTNRDGQMVTTAFPLTPMAIKSATIDKAGTITVDGQNFADGIQATYQLGGQATATGPANWDKAAPNALTVTFNPPVSPAPSAALVLKSPIGLVARAPVTMK